MEGDLIRVFQSNANGASQRRRDRQLDVIGAVSSDLVVLTEVSAGSGATEYLAALRDAGAPWPERTLDLRVARPTRPILVIAVYAPLGMHGDAKSATFEAIGARIATTSEPLVLTGDFNAPRYEGVDANSQPVLVTFGQARRRSGGFGPTGSRQDRAERLVLDGSSLGLVDVYRSVHGYQARAVSWSMTRPGRTYDYRLDQVLVRGDLDPKAACYRAELRMAFGGQGGLSDHAAIGAEVVLGRRPQAAR